MMNLLRTIWIGIKMLFQNPDDRGSGLLDPPDPEPAPDPADEDPIQPAAADRSLDETIARIAEVMARHEGFYLTDYNSLAKRNNNPGNLRMAGAYRNPPFYGVPGERNFIRFPTVELGWKALCYQIELDMVTRGKTLKEFITKFAPPEDNNDTEAYIAAVSLYTGIGRDERLV